MGSRLSVGLFGVSTSAYIEDFKGLLCCDIQRNEEKCGAGSLSLKRFLALNSSKKYFSVMASWPRKLFLSDEHSDVKLRIEAELSGKQLDFPAHSLVLKTASPVFSLMLDGEKFKEGRTGVIEIKVPGYETSAVAFIKYIYSADLDYLDLDVYLALLQAGHLYQINTLVQDCETRILPKITPCSACQILEKVKVLGESEVYKQCIRVICRTAFLVFDRNLHLPVSLKTLNCLLPLDQLTVLDEDQIFRALWSWGKASVFAKGRSGDKDVMDEITPLLGHVRWSFVTNAGKFTRMYEQHQTKKKEQKTETVSRRKPSSIISLLPLSDTWDINSDTLEYGSRSYPDKGGKFKLLTFKVDRPILLSGFKLQISTSEWLYGKTDLHFDLFLNDRNVTDEVFFHFKLLSQSDDYNWFYVTCEFYVPILISSLSINTISILDRTNPPALEEVSLCDLREAKLFGIPKFCVLGDVLAVQKIYYFLKCVT